MPLPSGEEIERDFAAKIANGRKVGVEKFCVKSRSSKEMPKTLQICEDMSDDMKNIPLDPECEVSINF